MVLDYFAEDLFSLFEGVFHQIDVLLFFLQPEDIEYLIAQPLLTVVFVQRHYFVHAKWHHFVSILLDYDHLSIQDALIRIDMAPNNLNELLI